MSAESRTPSVPVAWQRKIREERAITDRDNLFGAWWDDLDRDIGNAVVREIDMRTATNLIREYEWLGCMPASVLHCFGIYFDGALGGCVVYSPDYAENLGVWDRFDWTGKIILLSRGACVHWAHEHAASKLITRSIRMLPPKYEVVTATVDAEAGEVGTIYQACSFVHLGAMDTHSRYGARIRGQLYSSRYLRQLGIGNKSKILEAHPDAELVRELPKGRYFHFRRNRRRHMRAVAGLVRPYPKRASEGSVEIRSASSGEGQVQPLADALESAA